MSFLASRAMLAHVKISLWSARALDRKVTDEVNQSHGARADAGRYNKSLIDPAALAPIVTAQGAVRAYHYANTLPWEDDGARLLPSALFDAYSTRVRQFGEEFDAAVATFLDAYPAHVEAARVRLNGMFRAEDYPSAGDIAKRFAFRRTIGAVPSPEDFRVALGDAQSALIRAEIEERAAEALRAAMADVNARVTDAVGKMAEKLRAYNPGSKGERAEGIFRDSLVENVRDLAAILPGLNITSDPILAKVAARMSAELVQHDAAELRESATLRETIAASAESILSDVSEFLA